MGKYENTEWYLKESKAYIDQYGEVPPPWMYYPNAHPYSIGWRMGGGESFIMVLHEWLEQQKFTEEERIAYMRKYPPPPRWLEWAASFIWNLDTVDHPDLDFTPYFEKLEMLGFEGVSDFEKDFNNDQWE
ncbi:hypothetical protein AAG747_16655 [Rapidithrix thailandica]|uniref:Uncharacterized protein n=1 Tax=Rapidithrix thailandica TaxID=413964 RepID=A0AAW9S965_9BACT